MTYFSMYEVNGQANDCALTLEGIYQTQYSSSVFYILLLFACM